MENDVRDTPHNASGETPRNVEAHPAGVGAVLREARERLGLSVEDVVKRIKFAPRQIAALEADDFAQLPEIAFVRGFVRSYSRLVQLDPAPLLAALPHEPATAIPVAENALTEVPFPKAYSARISKKILLATVLVVALALAWGLFTWLNGSKSNVPNLPAEPQVKVETLELPPMVVLPDSEAPSVSSSAVNAVPAQVPIAPADSAGARIPPEAKAPVGFSAQSLRIDTSDARFSQKEPGALPKSTGTLRLTFDLEAWVEVQDKDGRILLSQINPRGSEQSLSGRPPFTLVIGNAKGVHLYYQGQPVDLGPHIKVEVARLTLE